MKPDLINFVYFKSCNHIEKGDNKRLKTEQRLLEKEIKASAQKSSSEERKSSLVKFAEGIRGGIYIVSGISLAIVIILGQSGAFITINDIIGNMILATLGKFILIIIAFALIIYGLKNLRFLK
jgi:hypothetical protein